MLLVPSRLVAGFWDLPELYDGAQLGAALGEFRHSITHHRYRFLVCEGLAKRLPNGHRWVAFDQLGETPLSTIARKAVKISQAGDLRYTPR